MFEGALPEVQAASYLLLALLPVTILAPLRWAVLAWLLMGNLDATGPGQLSAISTGWLNAAKSLVIPLWLAWRMRSVPNPGVRALPGKLWALLICYAALAVSWGPFPLAGFKLVGNMVGILLSVIVLEKAARHRLLDDATLVAVIFGSLSLAAVQTYYYGGASYGFDGFDQPSRLSSFIGAQQFAAFLVAFLALVLWRQDLTRTARALCLLSIPIALALNGSRVWFFGSAIVLALFYMWELRRFAFATATLLGFVVSLVFFINSFQLYPLELVSASSNRIVYTLSALTTGVDSAQQVGLRDLTFRTAIYNGVLGDIASSSVKEIVFGHGTSSGAEAVGRVFPAADSADPNRIVHNEWLRAAYEWGVIGVLLLISFFGSLIFGLFSLRKCRELRVNASAAVSFLFAFLLAFSGENVLAGAGNAVTMSLALTIGMIWTPAPRLPRNS